MSKQKKNSQQVTFTEKETIFLTRNIFVYVSETYNKGCCFSIYMFQKRLSIECLGDEM